MRLVMKRSDREIYNLIKCLCSYIDRGDTKSVDGLMAALAERWVERSIWTRKQWKKYHILVGS